MAAVAKTGSAPSRWRQLYWIVPVVVVVAVGLVFLARWLRTLPEVQAWLGAYPGAYDLPAGAPVGIPAWAGWQHFFNIFLMALIIRSGWQVRTVKRPPAYWTRKNTA